jgi:hypothetical protein
MTEENKENSPVYLRYRIGRCAGLLVNKEPLRRKTERLVYI